MSSAFVVGYTGVTGKIVVNELVSRKRFDRLVLIGRRPYEAELPLGVECKVVNFDELDKHEQDFAGFDHGFACLGAWISTQGRETFVKIDKEVTVKVAEMAKKGGTKHFHVITSQGAKPSSINFYLRIKGEAEAGIAACGFNRVSVYRPGYIVCDREKEAPGTSVMKPILKLSDRLFPSLCTTHPLDIARAMIARSMLEDTPEPEVVRLSIADILKWSRELGPTPTAEGAEK